MVGCAWGWRPADAEGLGDVEAWAQFDAERHLTIAHVTTLMPDWVDVMLLVPHMRGFVRFLVGEGAISESDAERLDHEYAMFDPTEAPRAVARGGGPSPTGGTIAQLVRFGCRERCSTYREPVVAGSE